MINLAVNYSPPPKIQCLFQDAGTSILFMVVPRFVWVGWHHRFDGHEFEQAPGVGDGQGSLACCSPRGHKESDATEQLN